MGEEVVGVNISRWKEDIRIQLEPQALGSNQSITSQIRNINKLSTRLCSSAVFQFKFKEFIQWFDSFMFYIACCILISCVRAVVLYSLKSHNTTCMPIPGVSHETPPQQVARAIAKGLEKSARKYPNNGGENNPKEKQSQKLSKSNLAEAIR